MSDFKTRLLDEKAQLDERRSKLSPFIDSEKFKELPQVQQSLLKAQYGVMSTYSVILNERIENLG